MAELKTKATGASVEAYLNKIPDKQTQSDCRTISDIMKKVTKSEPKMWGTSIVGFGSYFLKYTSGRELDWFYTGFSNRKNSITLYMMVGFDKYPDLMQKLGKYKTSKSCLYIKKLEDINLVVLKKLITESVNKMKKKK
ncbi:MAG: DUF1801 domain-containing protein [Melioribacteraceae bacterium]